MNKVTAAFLILILCTFTLVSAEFTPGRDDFIGERFIAGDTWYDFQTNGSLGKMIAVDPDGNIHITWTDGYTDDLEQGERHQKYNYFISEEEEWLEEGGIAIDSETKGGFGCLWLTTDETPRPLAFFHAKLDTAWRGFCGVDLGTGWGAFVYLPLPTLQDQAAYFPQGVMTPDGRIHIALQRRDRGMIAYAAGELDENDIPVFGDRLIEVGATHRTNLRIACSPQSERVAIGWTTSRVGIPAPDNWGGTAYAMNSDLMLAWTENGEDWNFDDPLNVTDNIPPNPRLEGDASYGDTLRPYANFDIIFDANDYIHIVFDARGFWEQPIPEDEPPVDGITIDASVLFHWSEETGEFSPVADGWFTHREVDEEGETIRWPTPGGWQSNVCAPSLAYDEDGDIYCVFNYYPPEDYSNEDYCNGDIAVTVSQDNGESWYLPTMITETRTHLAEEGESECEIYPTLAAVIDDYLHISYELDTEPGSPISDHADRNEWQSLCPWMYHRVPVEEVMREEIWEDGPDWHAHYEAVRSEGREPVPCCITLDPPYPNPFNAVTNISYTLFTPSAVWLRIYDVNGHVVETLIDNRLQAAGRYIIGWDCRSVSAGVYLVRLETGCFSAVRKAVLVK